MRFEVIGKPVPKGRHRTTKKGISYTPKKTKDYEKRIANRFKEEMQKAGLEIPLFKKGEEVSMLIYAGKRIPKSYSKKKREEILKYGRKPTTRPDVDNYEKIVLDALNGLAYVDDGQVSQTLTKKMYVRDDVEERMMIDIRRDLPPEIVELLNKKN